MSTPILLASGTLTATTTTTLFSNNAGDIAIGITVRNPAGGSSNAVTINSSNGSASALERLVVTLGAGEWFTFNGLGLNPGAVVTGGDEDAAATFEITNIMPGTPLGFKVYTADGSLKTAQTTVYTTPQVITSASANAFAVGLNGTTNPAFNVDASTASSATGFNVKSAAAAAGAALSVISSGTNEAGKIDSKGSGTLTVQSVGTGNFVVGATKLTVAPATGNLSSAGSILSTSPTLGVGYATGAGGAVTQSTDKSTTVVSNTITTAITLNNANLAAATIVSFTFTNSAIAATDQVVVTHQSAGTSGAYTFNAFPGAGSAVISVRNNTAGGLAEAIVLRVSVYKAVSA